MQDGAKRRPVDPVDQPEDQQHQQRRAELRHERDGRHQLSDVNRSRAGEPPSSRSRPGVEVSPSDSKGHHPVAVTGLFDA